MRFFAAFSVVLAGLALPVAAKPVEPGEALLIQQDNRSAQQRRASGVVPVPAAAPVVVPAPVAAPPVRAARPAQVVNAPRPARKLIAIPWQTGIFQ